MPGFPSSSFGPNQPAYNREYTSSSLNEESPTVAFVIFAMKLTVIAAKACACPYKAYVDYMTGLLFGLVVLVIFSFFSITRYEKNG